MTEQLEERVVDITTGGSTKYTGASSIESNELGAYIEASEFVYTGNEAKIDYDREPLDETNLTDTAKKLLQWEAAVPNDVPEQGQSQIPATTEGTPKEIKYEPIPVDKTFLNLSQDYGVPNLTVDESDAEFQVFASQMEKFLGHDFETYKSQRESLRNANKLRKELETQKLSDNVRKQEQYIKDKWKVTDSVYETRMRQVVDVFSKLDESMQMLLDRDPNGALKLWKDIESTEQINNTVPKFDKSASTISGSDVGKPRFTRSEIDSLLPAEKKKLWQKINQAAQQGLIDWDR